MFDEFDRYLNQQDRSPLTVRGYLADLRTFAVWFQHTNGEDLRPSGVTPKRHQGIPPISAHRGKSESGDD